MIKVGNTEVIDVKRGVEQIAKVFAGTNLVWQKEGSPPEPGEPLGVRGVGGVVEGNLTEYLNPTLPVGTQKDDILLLFIQSDNRHFSIVNDAGWSVLLDTSETGNGISSITILWKRAVEGQITPGFAPQSARALAQILGIKGAKKVGNPFEADIYQAANFTGSGTVNNTIEGITTTEDNVLIVTGVCNNSFNIGAFYSSFANANLTDFAEQIDCGGTGRGHIGVACGFKSSPGASGNSTVTAGANGYGGSFTFGIKPQT